MSVQRRAVDLIGDEIGGLQNGLKADGRQRRAIGHVLAGIGRKGDEKADTETPGRDNAHCPTDPEQTQTHTKPRAGDAVPKKSQPKTHRRSPMVIAA